MAFGDLKGTLTGAATSITNPFSATGSVSVSVGDLIIAVLAERTSLTVTGVTDNLGHTYTAQNAGNDAGNAAGRAFWFIATAGGTLTSVSAAATASADDVAFSVAVFSGPFAASPLDASPANITNDTTSPFTCPSTGTLAQADELVIAWAAIERGNSNDAATSPNLLAINTMSSTADASVSVSADIGYQVVAATTAVAPAFTRASGTTSSDVLGTMSFKKGTAALAIPVVLNQYRSRRLG